MSAMISAISKYAIPILLALLLASIAYGSYQSMDNRRLQSVVEMYQSQVSHAVTLDEMNKATAQANQAMLQAAIDKQNEQFQQLWTMSEQNSNLIITRVREQGVITAGHFQRTTKAIDNLTVDSCQGLIDALIAFPKTGSTVWPTTR